MARRTRIKICGLTRAADVDAAVAAGADAIGFVFYPQSARFIEPQRAAELARRLPPFVVPIGLFVDASEADVAAAFAAMPLLMPQFHGDESAAACARFGRPWLRAARVGAGFDLLDFAARQKGAQALLLDAHVEGYGGGGKVFDWSLVHDVIGRLDVPVVLSGGLNAANVSRGIATLRPWAVDVSSGVESAKGIKDAEAIRRFCDAVRDADASLAGPTASPA